MGNLLEELNEDLTETVEKVRRSLVEIHHGHGGTGAGVILRGDGLIVTNATMINGPDVGVAVPAHVVTTFLTQVAEIKRANQPRHVESMAV